MVRDEGVALDTAGRNVDVTLVHKKSGLQHYEMGKAGLILKGVTSLDKV